MGLNTATIREAIATKLQTTCGLNAFPYEVVPQVYPRARVLPDTPTIVYHGTFGTSGMSELAFNVEVAVSSPDPVAGQKVLATYIGTGVSTSVLDALEADVTLAGAVDNLVVESVTLGQGTQYTDNGPIEFVATFKVAVRARRG